MAHGEGYHREFGWDTDYGTRHDPAPEGVWIAKVDGRRVGCVFLVGGDRPGLARLRLLLVAPEGRGHRLGTRLVAECLAFSREAGYERVTLWTNDVLVSARRIYQACGFGHDLVGQNWIPDLPHGA
ncbi:GNAT family N-acetyltransferase [Streptomyces sp. R302]|uniref:GNAT family N-acetyltransferase n=1 Tax=unclassified Streptomyces TaxID=2593676 RepID=UPI00145CB249|nr:GNAT family N-acetyltransferase [Streptomyces sp. R301]NML81425.1 GNAT family N-acetyltransferase [Streptomyces sp. R302]